MKKRLAPRNSPAEREASAWSVRVANGSTPGNRERTALRGDTLPSGPDHVRNVVGAPGRPLSEAERNRFEPAFGHDFSRVRLHNDAASAESAATFGVRAYAVGNHIVLGERVASNPLSATAIPVMAHELSHVVQHSSAFHATQSAGEIHGQRDCDQEQIECFRRCWRRKPPWPIDRGSRGHYLYCQSKCLAEYMVCIGENAADYAFNTMAAAMQWLADHPEIVVGTIVVVAGVTYIVATGGAGALVLVPAVL